MAFLVVINVRETRSYLYANWLEFWFSVVITKKKPKEWLKEHRPHESGGRDDLSFHNHLLGKQSENKVIFVFNGCSQDYYNT